MKDTIIKRIQNLTLEQQKQVMAFLETIPKDGLRGYSRLSTKLALDDAIWKSLNE